MIVRVRAPIRLKRGMGQSPLPSNACQYKLPGISQDPSIPFCAAGGYQMSAAQIASVKAAQIGGGYSDVSGGAFGTGVSGPTGILATLPVVPEPKSPPLAVQSNAPAATPVTATSSSAPVQSNAPAPTPASTNSWANVFGITNPPATVTPGGVMTPAVSGCFSLFAGESCIGPIGSTTLLVGAAAILGLFLLAGHK